MHWLNFSAELNLLDTRILGNGTLLDTRIPGNWTLLDTWIPLDHRRQLHGRKKTPLYVSGSDNSIIFLLRLDIRYSSFLSHPGSHQDEGDPLTCKSNSSMI